MNSGAGSRLPPERSVGFNGETDISILKLTSMDSGSIRNIELGILSLLGRLEALTSGM